MPFTVSTRKRPQLTLHRTPHIVIAPLLLLAVGKVEDVLVEERGLLGVLRAFKPGFAPCSVSRAYSERAENAYLKPS